MSEKGTSGRCFGSLDVRGAHSGGGFTLIEVVIAMALLSFVLLTTILILLDRKETAIAADQQSRAWQAIANEAEIRRYSPWGSLVDGSEQPFESDLTILDGMDAETSVVVQQTEPDLKVLTLEVQWGTRRAGIEVVRSNTGHGGLW